MAHYRVVIESLEALLKTDFTGGIPDTELDREERELLFGRNVFV